MFVAALNPRAIAILILFDRCTYHSWRTIGPGVDADESSMQKLLHHYGNTTASRFDSVTYIGVNLANKVQKKNPLCVY